MARTRVRQETETVQGFTPVTSVAEGGANVTFPDGVMHIDGSPQGPSTVVEWKSSNGLTTYTTVEWVDPSSGERRTSCNCPGWTRKKQKGRARWCCHTQDMEGVKPCTTRTRVDTTQIRTVQEAIDTIPRIVDGRELRGILL